MKSKSTITLHPDRQYLVKLYVGAVVTLFFSTIWLVFPLMDSGLRSSGAVIGALTGAFALGVVILVVASVLINAYYRSIWYEIRPDEVIVRKGIITKRVKHVPFRTVTNLEVTRGPLDRMLGIGALSIQTAGAGSAATPEEKLVGMRDIQELYEYVAAELRRFRGAMSPTQSEDEELHAGNGFVSGNEEVLNAILSELRAIHAELGQANR